MTVAYFITLFIWLYLWTVLMSSVLFSILDQLFRPTRAPDTVFRRLRDVLFLHINNAPRFIWIRRACSTPVCGIFYEPGSSVPAGNRAECSRAGIELSFLMHSWFSSPPDASAVKHLSPSTHCMLWHCNICNACEASQRRCSRHMRSGQEKAKRSPSQHIKLSCHRDWL